MRNHLPNTGPKLWFSEPCRCAWQQLSLLSFPDGRLERQRSRCRRLGASLQIPCMVAKSTRSVRPLPHRELRGTFSSLVSGRWPLEPSGRSQNVVWPVRCLGHQWPGSWAAEQVRVLEGGSVLSVALKVRTHLCWSSSGLAKGRRSRSVVTAAQVRGER